MNVINNKFLRCIFDIILKIFGRRKILKYTTKGALNIILMIVNIGVELLMVMVIYKIKLKGKYMVNQSMLSLKI